MNILIVGDSLSSCGGFDDPTGKIWYSMIPQTNITNLSIGGQCNTKIYIKTISELIKNPTNYDLIVVQWSSLFRISFNQGRTIHDNQTSFNLAHPGKKFKRFQQLWRNNFINPRVELLEWLTQITSLATLLKSYNQNFVFIKAFNNFLPNLEHADWRNCSRDFLELVLNLSGLPDEDITKYYNELRTVYLAMKTVSCQHWLNLHTPDWTQSATDHADDQSHPGVNSHKIYFEDFIKKIVLTT